MRRTEMKKLFTGVAVTLVAAVWMTGSWLFFNSIAAGAQGSGTAAVADVNKPCPKDAAKAHCGHCKHGHWRHHLMKKLNLTEAQKTQIKAIVSEERPKMKALFKQLQDGREQLAPLVKSGTFDEAKVRSIAKGMADNTVVEMIVTKARMKSRIWAVLTSEQRAKAEKLHEAWKTLHGDEEGPMHKD